MRVNAASRDLKSVWCNELFLIGLIIRPVPSLLKIQCGATEIRSRTTADPSPAAQDDKGNQVTIELGGIPGLKIETWGTR
jgi:hypothetical protein